MLQERNLDLFMIRSSGEIDEETKKPLYWSNGDGWVDRDSADLFSWYGKKRFNLPVGGIWEKV